MQENKQIYSQQIESLKVALTNSDTRIEIEAENVFEMKTQLMRLKHYGQNLQSILGRLDNICICNIYKPILRFDKYLDGIQIGRSVHTFTDKGRGSQSAADPAVKRIPEPCGTESGSSSDNISGINQFWFMKHF